MNSRSSVLLAKYDVPVPRYTSYPAMPAWDNSSFSVEHWNQSVQRCFAETNDSKGISLYIHLPFCESLCTYCACNTRITKNHAVEIRYIQMVLKEWEHYKRIFAGKPKLRELHIGGGTPTFFSPRNLHWLISYILEDVDLHDDLEMSFEGHPNNTSEEHLRILYELGFRRVSFGVQDLDEDVQKAINRIQPLENLKTVTHTARSIGYESIGFDLIYGLPKQTPFSVSDTFDRVLALRPERIAFYSYAHVPWFRPGQRGYEEADLPSSFLKRHLYELGRHKLNKAGYADIGMDHFALPNDNLFKATIAGTLHRNFMGYTTCTSDLLIGLGASAISDAKYAYAQNEKKVEDYDQRLVLNGSAVMKGHVMTAEDILIRRCILQLCCQGHLDKKLFDEVMTESMYTTLSGMEEEGILYLMDDGLTIRSAGFPFIRNICQVFDKRMEKVNQDKPVFSKAI